MIMIARKINLSKTSNHVRLMGGANVSEEFNAEEILSKTSPLPASIQDEILHPPTPPVTPSSSFIKESVDSSPIEEFTRSDTDKKSQEDKQPLSASGPCCFCVSQSPRSVG